MVFFIPLMIFIKNIYYHLFILICHDNGVVHHKLQRMSTSAIYTSNDELKKTMLWLADNNMSLKTSAKIAYHIIILRITIIISDMN